MEYIFLRQGTVLCLSDTEAVPVSTVEFSFGFSGYFLVGGGVEVSFNLSKFWRLLTD